MHSIRVLLFSCLLPFFGASQNGTTIIGGTTTSEYGSSITRNSVGDLFIGGTHENDVMVTKLNPSGEVIWANSYNFSTIPDYLMEIVITSDNFIIGTGTSRTTSNNNPQGFIFKLDTAGTLIWKRVTNCNNVYMWQLGLIEAENGNYQTCGSQNTNGHQDNFIAEFDALTGLKVWDSVYARGSLGNNFDEVFYSIDKNPTNNASYLSGRFHSPSGQLNYHASITKINTNGSLAWSKTYVHPFSSSGGRFYGVSLDFDGDSLVGLISGKLGSTSTPFQVGIYKTDSSGIMSWGKMYTASGRDLRSYHIKTVPGGYLISGYINNGNRNLFIIKTDQSGNVLWSNQYGSLGLEDVKFGASNNCSMVVGNEILFVGRTTAFSGGDDIILFNIDLTTGNLTNGSGCASPLAVSTVNLPVFEQDYQLVRGPLSMITSDPIVPVAPIVFNQTGNLVEVVTDTIVSNDTLYLCPNDVVSVEADWNPNYTYLWNTANTAQIQPISTTGWYTVSISAAGCTILTDSVYAVVGAGNVNLGADTSLCDVGVFTLDATAVGATYLWSDNSTGPTLDVSISGTYWVEVSTGSCTFQDSISVVFGTTPIVNLGNDTTICMLNSLLLDAQNAGASYLWQDGSVNQTFNASVSGQYYVEVSSGGCLASDTINLTVLPTPVVDLGNDTTICGAVSLLLDASGTVGTYLWQDGSSLSSLNVTSAGIYWVEVDNGVCIGTDSIVVLNPTTPIVNLGNDTTICELNSVLLDAQNPGASYLWQDGSVNQTFNASVSGQYYVEVNAGGCFATDTINLTVLPIPVADLGNDTIICGTVALLLDASGTVGDYLWQDGSNLPFMNVASAGIYWVEIDNGVCTGTDSIIVLNPPTPIVNLGNDTTFCEVNSVLLDAQNAGATYLWQDGSVNQTFNASVSGQYYVEVNSGGCFASDTINVTVLPTPVVDLGNDITTCSAQTIVLDATVAGVTYLWQDGSTNSSYNVSSSGTYSVVLDNGFCTATDTVDITFNSPANIDLGNDTLICANELIILDVFTPNATYNWSTSSTSPNIDVVQAGTYWVIVDLNGCISSDTIVVSTISPPSVDQADLEFCIDESVTITLSDAANLSYIWQDGSTQSTYVIDQPGTYQVTATNQCGTDATQFIADMKNCDCEMYVPNAFTPDDSEINQTFGAITECPLQIFEFEIYNRWGEVIFNSFDINVFWDGTYSGSEVQDGVYTWKIKYQFNDFPEAIITGHVTVIR